MDLDEGKGLEKFVVDEEAFSVWDLGSSLTCGGKGGIMKPVTARPSTDMCEGS
jgi:hypothetical protein